jgi:hypothetical protein
VLHFLGFPLVFVARLAGEKSSLELSLKRELTRVTNSTRVSRNRYAIFDVIEVPRRLILYGMP